MLLLRTTVVLLIVVVLVKFGAIFNAGELLLTGFNLNNPSAQNANNLPVINTDPLAVPKQNDEGKEDDPTNYAPALGGGDSPPKILTEEAILDSAKDARNFLNRKDVGEFPVDNNGLTPVDEKSKDLQISDKQALLDAVSRRLSEREAQLREKQEKIGQLLEQYEDKQDEDIQRLISLYSAMKARAAAAIFDKMDLTTLLPVARGMLPRNLAPILAGMDPDRARIISESLSGRNADVVALKQELEDLERQKRALLPVEENDASITNPGQPTNIGDLIDPAEGIESLIQ